MNQFSRPGSPLPAELPQRLRLSPSILGAYPVILQLEEKKRSLWARSPANDELKKGLIWVRIIGYLLLEGSSDHARVAVAREVNSCAGDEDKIIDIGKYYYDFFLCAFRQHRGCASTPPSDDSRSSFNRRMERMSDMIKEAPQDCRQAKKQTAFSNFEMWALIRDGSRCVLTGMYDISVIREMAYDKELLAGVEKFGFCPSECAYIFGQLKNVSISGENEQTGNYKHDKYAAGMQWTVLKRLGYEKIITDLNGKNFHSLENVMTLQYDARFYFDRFELWFEPTGAANTYRYATVYPGAIRVLNPTITFTTPNPEVLPVPSPEYLAIHATCCKVTHLSGAGEYIDRTLQELEDIQVLSPDGASAELLEYLLVPFSQQIEAQ